MNLKEIARCAVIGVAIGSLGGCAAIDNVITNIGGITGMPTAQILATVAAIQADVAKACAVEPDVVDIVSLWNATAGATVAGIAAVICGSVGSPPASARFHMTSNTKKAHLGAIWTPHTQVIHGIVVHFN